MNDKAYRLDRAFGGKKFQPYLYAGYGMNTSVASMKVRCPNAEPAGRVVLRNHKLVFRGVADVVWSLGRQAHLALWRVTADCEKSLDSLEGFRADGKGLYDKRYFKIEGRGPLAGQWAMIYVMTSRTYLAPPAQSYEATLRAGYADFGMPRSQIDVAIDEAKAGNWSNGTRSVSVRPVAERPMPRQRTLIPKEDKSYRRALNCGAFCHEPEECEERGCALKRDPIDVEEGE